MTLTLNGTTGIVALDNSKVKLGTGGDLEIYHDGSNSYVDDAGTGRLYLRGNDRVQIQKYTGEDMFTAIADGETKLYYNNAKKLETTNTGVTITGNIVVASGNGIDFSATADGNTVGSELFDDYEEGTWSPALVGGGSFSATQSNSGTYTKIGRLVFVQVVMNISSYSQGSATHPYISGLPFAPDGGSSVSTFGYGNSYNTTHMFTVSDVTGAALSGTNFYLYRGGQSGTGNVFVQKGQVQDGRVNMALVYYA